MISIKTTITLTLVNAAAIILSSSLSSHTSSTPTLATIDLPSQTFTPPLTSPSPTVPPVSSSSHLTPPTPPPSSSTPLPLPTPDRRCLVQVRGQVFDVTSLKTTHSGGDIFQCGTDMTSNFNAQHNDTVFALLLRYKI